MYLQPRYRVSKWSYLGRRSGPVDNNHNDLPVVLGRPGVGRVWVCWVPSYSPWYPRSYISSNWDGRSYRLFSTFPVSYTPFVPKDLLYDRLTHELFISLQEIDYVKILKVKKPPTGSGVTFSILKKKLRCYPRSKNWGTTESRSGHVTL